MTPYETVFKSFLKKVEDFDLPRLDEADQLAQLTEWLDSALVYMEMNCLDLDNDVTKRDNDEQVFLADLTTCEIEMIAMFMVAAWYEPRINSLEHTSLFVGVSSEKWTSQQQHLNMMTSARDRWLIEARKLYRNYRIHNNEYFDD